jgi:hypothetical protein
MENRFNKLIDELSQCLITNKKEFIFLLKECGIKVFDTKDSSLIDLFIYNSDNKKLLLGASILINQCHKSNFDSIDQLSVKSDYGILNDYLNGFLIANDEDYYNLDNEVKDKPKEDEPKEAVGSSLLKGGSSGGVVGAIAGALQEGFKFGGQINKSRADKRAVANQYSNSLLNRDIARKDMYAKIMESKYSPKDKNKTGNNKIIIGSIIGLSLISIVAFIIYKKNS